MATMLNGAAVMDAALLLIAANQQVPRPQTSEHLAAAEIMKLKNIIVLQSKLDLVHEKAAFENFSQIKQFIHGTVAEDSPVIPISFTPKLQCNIDVLLYYLCEKVPVPVRDFKSPPFLTVVRSFDVNNPGETLDKLKGGVAGGTLKRGVLQVGQQIEIRPGIMTKDSNGKVHCKPIFTRVISLFAEQTKLEFAVPGGLIGVGTTLDPTLTKDDRLVGQVLGAVGQLPEVYQDVEISFQLMRHVIGVSEDADSKENVSEANGDPHKTEKIRTLKSGEKITVSVGSTSTSATVTAVKGKSAKLSLFKPCCVEINESVSLSRKFNSSWRLIGCGKIVHGIPLRLEKDK